jgi:hypothetical protein
MALTTTHALKEWAAAIEALERGKTIVLLRKGGIHEENRRFQVKFDRVLLYPTYEHQRPDRLKPEYADRVRPVPSGWHPETIRIGSWAEITDVLAVSAEPAVTKLLPYHIWNQQLASDRLKWKPNEPLFVLLLRTYKLRSPQVIPYRAEYGGCQSWLDLQAAIAIEPQEPVLSDLAYNQQTAAIRQLLESDCER